VNVFCGHSVGLSDDGLVLGIGSSRGNGPVNPFSTNQGKARMYQGTAITTGTSSLNAVDIAVQPNPVSDHITVRSEVAVERLDLFDLSGKFLLGNRMQKDMDLSGLSHGPYLLRVTFTNGSVGYSRVLKL
jgi:hypothetical protein